MRYNKNDRPAPSINEHPRQPERHISEAATSLPSLRNSPIVNDEYYIITSNLCQSIITIADTIGELVEDVILSVEKNRAVTVHYLVWIKERIWQIRSLSEVIDDRIQHEDFEKIAEWALHACL